MKDNLQIYYIPKEESTERGSFIYCISDDKKIPASRYYMIDFPDFNKNNIFQNIIMKRIVNIMYFMKVINSIPEKIKTETNLYNFAKCLFDYEIYFRTNDIKKSYPRKENRINNPRISLNEKQMNHIMQMNKRTDIDELIKRINLNVKTIKKKDIESTRVQLKRLSYYSNMMNNIYNKESFLSNINDTDIIFINENYQKVKKDKKRKYD